MADLGTAAVSTATLGSLLWKGGGLNQSLNKVTNLRRTPLCELWRAACAWRAGLLPTSGRLTGAASVERQSQSSWVKQGSMLRCGLVSPPSGTRAAHCIPNTSFPCSPDDSKRHEAPKVRCGTVDALPAPVCCARLHSCSLRGTGVVHHSAPCRTNSPRLQYWQHMRRAQTLFFCTAGR